MIQDILNKFVELTSKRNALLQGLVPDIPLRRIGRPEDIAGAVVFFASEQAGWITGQLLFVHGGHRMALEQ